MRLTQKRLKEVIKYSPLTGEFIWKVSPSGCVKIGDDAGCIDKSNGYRRIDIDCKKYLGHRLVWLYVHGEFPWGHLDHINHVPGDDRLCNLREVTHSENHRNRSKAANNKSGVTGVSWYEQTWKWQAYITLNGKREKLGYFEEFTDAVNARKEAERNYNFHKNHGK